jgi:hypothetical protein
LLDADPNHVRKELAKLSRSKNQDTQANILLYALEGFLNRLAISESSPTLVLKGGMLLAAFNQRRPTTDIDFAARGFQNSDDQVRIRIQKILERPMNDGLVFHPETLRLDEIRTSAAYFGQRASFDVFLGSSRVTLRLDMNFGDEIYPGAQLIDYPTLLPDLRPRFTLTAYPIELVIAEKFVTMLLWLSANTRLKDVADILGLLPLADPEKLRSSIQRVASSQNVVNFDVRQLLTEWASNQQDAWLARESKNYPHLAGKTFVDVFEIVADVIFGLLHAGDK